MNSRKISKILSKSRGRARIGGCKFEKEGLNYKKSAHKWVLNQNNLGPLAANQLYANYLREF